MGWFISSMLGELYAEDGCLEQVKPVQFVISVSCIIFFEILYLKEILTKAQSVNSTLFDIKIKVNNK